MHKKSHSKRLYWITNHYTYYHDHFFRNLHAQGPFELVVCYRRLILESHPWKKVDAGAYKSLELVRFPFGLDLRILTRVVFGSHVFVISGWNSLIYLVLITILRIRNRPFAVFSDTPRRPGEGLKQRLKKSWLKFVFSKRSVGKMLVTGNIGVNRILEYYQLPVDKVINFPFTTDHELFKPEDRIVQEKDAGPVIFLAVGRIDFIHKGQDIALRALAAIVKRGRKNFRFRIAGTGEDLERMKVLVAELGLEPYVEHLGWVEIRDLPRLFNQAHFTLHSSHDDPFPNAVLESLSCGVPVISSDAAGSALDRIEQGLNGFLFPDGDVSTLERLLEFVLDMHESQWREMKAKCREGALAWPPAYNVKVVSNLFKEGSTL